MLGGRGKYACKRGHHWFVAVGVVRAFITDLSPLIVSLRVK